MIKQRKAWSGQGLVEYALILMLMATAAILVLSQLGTDVRDTLHPLADSGQDDTPAWMTIKDDFLSRIQTFHDENGSWPRSWGTYAFTDIGLDPDDWNAPVAGLYWQPHGANVGLANHAGDNLQVYVRDLDGNLLHLYDNWNIWCPVNDDQCYYHTITPGNEIDLTTLMVLEEN